MNFPARLDNQPKGTGALVKGKTVVFQQQGIRLHDGCSTDIANKFVVVKFVVIGIHVVESISRFRYLVVRNHIVVGVFDVNAVPGFFDIRVLNDVVVGSDDLDAVPLLRQGIRLLPDNGDIVNGGVVRPG